jgi:hypothetical protein
MPIPSPIDYKLAEIEQLAAGVATALFVLRHCPDADVRQVREQTQAFANAVMETTHAIVADKE